MTSIDYLVVGGGGGGGTRHAGGGGAGGLLQGTATVDSVTALVMTVGDGGAGGAATFALNYGLGSSGGTSSIALASGSGSFSTVTANGGGGGTTTAAIAGYNGGSGGGALGTGANGGGTGTVGQGNDGGDGYTPGGFWAAGGGGGAGTAGTNASNAGGGNGGDGATWTGSGFTTAIASSLGLSNTTNVYFAGGGGGGSTGGVGGTGGAGGGGSGTSTSGNGVSGIANTGGGGGGGGLGGTVPTGGNGGSGVILLRFVFTGYLVTATPVSSAGGSATATDANSDGTWNLVATANTGYTFSSWSCSNGQSPTSTILATTTITPSAFTTCTASFETFSVTTVTPSVGLTSGGSSIIITGVGFASGATVKVGGNSCTSVAVDSSTSISCITPAGLSTGAKDVVVTNPDSATATSTGGFTYYDCVMENNSVYYGNKSWVLGLTSEMSLPAGYIQFNGSCATSAIWVNIVNVTSGGSSTGWIYGGMFDPAYAWNGVSVLGFKNSISGFLALATPAQSFQTDTLYVAQYAWTGSSSSLPGSPSTIPCSNCLTKTNPYGVTESGFVDYIAQFRSVSSPTVTGSISPSSGTLAGGTTIAITGTDFFSGATVTVGGNSCTSVSVDSSTSLTCVTPAGLSVGAKDVVVTNLDSSTVTKSGGFTYQATSTPQATLTISNAFLTGTAGTAIGLTTSGGSGRGAVSYSVGGTGCSVIGSSLRATGATTCYVTATKAASAGYLATTSGYKIFTFSLPTQAALVISNPINWNLPKGPMGVILTTTGGTGSGAVAYTASGLGCSLSGNRLSVVSNYLPVITVSCTVVATKAGSGIYDAISSVPRVFNFR